MIFKILQMIIRITKYPDADSCYPGFINSTVPVMQAEFSPKATRGMYVCAQLSTLNFGICIVYWIDYAFSTIPGISSYTWRVPVVLQAIFLYQWF